MFTDWFPAVDCWVSPVRCWLMVADCYVLLAGCFVPRFRISALGCSWFAFGCWPLATGCLTLIAGSWLLTTDRLPSVCICLLFTSWSFMKMQRCVKECQWIWKCESEWNWMRWNPTSLDSCLPGCRLAGPGDLVRVALPPPPAVAGIHCLAARRSRQALTRHTRERCLQTTQHSN